MSRLIGKNIMIVDDQVDLCDMLGIFFEEYGCTVHKAYSGNKAIALLDKITCDLILTDVKMPDGTGVDLLKFVKGSKYSNIKVIMMTGFVDVSEAVLQSFGSDKVLRKPTPFKDMCKEIEELL